MEITKKRRLTVAEEELSLASPFESKDHIVVFFDLETNGFQKDSDIIQIALKADEFSLNKYVCSLQPIPFYVTEVNGFSTVNGRLYQHGKLVSSRPVRQVLLRVLKFLIKLNKPCILVAHNNHVFDAPKLARAIQKCNLQSEFAKVISGFADSLPLFKKMMTKRRTLKGGFKLTSLASDLLKLPTYRAHDAVYDVYLLEQLVYKYINFERLVENKKTLHDVIERYENIEKSKERFQTLQPLETVITDSMRKRLSEAGITYHLLLTTYEAGENKLISLLQKKCLIAKKKIIYAIVDHFKNGSPSEYFLTSEGVDCDFEESFLEQWKNELGRYFNKQ